MGGNPSAVATPSCVSWAAACGGAATMGSPLNFQCENTCYTPADAESQLTSTQLTKRPRYHLKRQRFSWRRCLRTHAHLLVCEECWLEKGRRDFSVTNHIARCCRAMPALPRRKSPGESAWTGPNVQARTARLPMPGTNIHTSISCCNSLPCIIMSMTLISSMPAQPVWCSTHGRR